jgi:hypothetical protein
VEHPLDWLRELHEPLSSFRPALNFIAPWIGLAPKLSQYFSRFGLGSEDSTPRTFEACAKNEILGKYGSLLHNEYISVVRLVGSHFCDAIRGRIASS